MKIVLVILSMLLTAACTAAPARPIAANDPADPDAPVSAIRQGTALGTYISQRPVDPAPWREQNERVAPRPKQ